ncbi:hypothetical protein EON65_41890 [archaeon]|nr:MAG: hypothetical protein EON65_41890 [archaeon]
MMLSWIHDPSSTADGAHAVKDRYIDQKQVFSHLNSYFNSTSDSSMYSLANGTDDNNWPEWPLGVKYS